MRRGGHVADFVEKQSSLVGQFELSRLAAGRAGECAFLVTEQFAFQQILRNRRAVDFDERSGCPARFLMDGARHQVFAHSAFAAQQNGGVGRSHPFHRGQHFLHLPAARHQVGMLIALLQRFAQRSILDPQALHIQFLVHHHAHFVERKRLQNVVAGARFHGLDRGLDGPERGHDDDRHRGLEAFHRLQKIQSIHARQLEIGDHQVDRTALQQLQAGFGVFRGQGLETVVSQIELQEAAHLGFIFDNQNGRLRCRHELPALGRAPSSAGKNITKQAPFPTEFSRRMVP